MELNKPNMSQVDICVNFTVLFTLPAFKCLLTIVGLCSVMKPCSKELNLSQKIIIIFMYFKKKKK